MKNKFFMLLSVTFICINTQQAMGMEENNQTINWNRDNKTLFKLVYDYLDLPSARNFALTCKEMNKIHNNKIIPLYKQIITEWHMPDFAGDEIVPEKSLNLSFTNKNDKFFHKLFTLLPQMFPKLESITVKSTNPFREECLKPLMKMSHLKNLHVTLLSLNGKTIKNFMGHNDLKVKPRKLDCFHVATNIIEINFPMQTVLPINGMIIDVVKGLKNDAPASINISGIKMSCELDPIPEDHYLIVFHLEYNANGFISSGNNSFITKGKPYSFIAHNNVIANINIGEQIQN